MTRAGRPVALAAVAGALLGALAVVLALTVPGGGPFTHAPRREGVPPAMRAAGPGRPHLTVVGLGDSVPAGAACSCEDYVHLYGERLARDVGAGVTVDDRAQGGLDTAGLLRQLSPGSATSSAVARADVITVTAGANDFAAALGSYLAGSCGGPTAMDCLFNEVPVMQRRLTAVLERVRALTAGRRVALRVTDYWNVFEDGQVASDRFGDEYVRDTSSFTRAANTAICAAAAAVQAPCIDLYPVFKGADGGKDPTHLLAADGDHPSAEGQRVIAEALARVGYAPVA